MELPELALSLGRTSGHGGEQSVGVVVERQSLVRDADVVGVEVAQALERLQSLDTKRALEVTEHHHRHRGGRGAERGGVAELDDEPLDIRIGSSGLGAVGDRGRRGDGLGRRLRSGGALGAGQQQARSERSRADRGARTHEHGL